MKPVSSEDGRLLVAESSRRLQSCPSGSPGSFLNTFLFETRAV